MTAALVVVGTPIGNLDDLSPRVRAAIEGADVIACEDTRRTGRLLQAIGVDRSPYVVVNEHTEHNVAERLVERARDGANVVLVTDAGMPTVSDPGAALVAAFAAAGLPVSVVPGPDAVTTALAGSGFPTSRFVFEGFLPRRGGARRARLDEIAGATAVTVVFEAPHRVGRLFEDLEATCGPDRGIAVGRELTKLHEEWHRGTVASAREWLAESPRGEFVVVLDRAQPEEKSVDDDTIRAALSEAIVSGASRRDAVAEVVDRLGVAKRRAYGLAVDIDPD